MRRHKDYYSEIKLDYNTDSILIEEEKNGDLYFEIKNHVTNDILEAICFLINNTDKHHDFWDYRLPKKINYDNIKSERSLYLLLGGKESWNNKKSDFLVGWNEVNTDFEIMFSDLLLSSLTDSITFRDVANNIQRNLPMIKLYDYAIFLNIVK